MNLPEIFLVGSLWFWLLLAAETVVVLVLLEWDQGAIATLTFLATLILLQLMGDINIYGYVIEHPLTVALGAAGYFALGALWATAKWWFFVHEQRSWYDELRSAFVRMNRIDPQEAIPEGFQHIWWQCLGLAKKNGRRLEVRPLAAGHKLNILRWMSYWPWSFFWTMLKDPVRKAFQTIYHNIAEYLQEISDRTFKGVEMDLPPEEEVPAADRTDPVLVEFGIDPTVLRIEKKAARANTPQHALRD